MSDQTPAPATNGPIDIGQAMRDVVAQLQQEPQRYKLFGVYWWAIKALLRRLGYGPAQLFLLGPYVDSETAAMVPRAGLQATIEAAFEQYAQNARDPRADGRVENPDGEIVTIDDMDAWI